MMKWGKKLDSYLTLYIKIISRWSKYLIVKDDILEEI